MINWNSAGGTCWLMGEVPKTAMIAIESWRQGVAWFCTILATGPIADIELESLAF
jgi:hypothetical protein